MEKRNRTFGQKKTKTPNGVQNENENKRFSKSKFKSNTLTLQDKEEQLPVKREEKAEKRDATFYTKRLQETFSTCYKFTEMPTNQEILVLTQPSEPHRGFSVLSKGQCVIVETFDGTDKRLVIAEDGRQGIIPLNSGAKRISI